MNKRGQVEAIGLLILLGVVLIGSVGTINAISENRYIADTSTGLIYDMAKCSIKNLNDDNLVLVRDLDDFIQRTNFKLAQC